MHLLVWKLEIELGKTPEISLTKHDLYNAIGEKQKANQEIEVLLAEYPNNEDIRTQIWHIILKIKQIN